MLVLRFGAGGTNACDYCFRVSSTNLSVTSARQCFGAIVNNDLCLCIPPQALPLKSTTTIVCFTSTTRASLWSLLMTGLAHTWWVFCCCFFFQKTNDSSEYLLLACSCAGRLSYGALLKWLELFCPVTNVTSCCADVFPKQGLGAFIRKQKNFRARFTFQSIFICWNGPVKVQA